MKLLLHTCCAPCLVYPLERLKEKFYVTAFFYNPNIHGFIEYRNRLNSVKDFSLKESLDVICPDYLPEEFFDNVDTKVMPQRCRLCWSLRLEKAAVFARENGYDYFSTTLLVSPYQSQEIIKEVAQEISDRLKVKFYYEDFRFGFKKSHDFARANNMYMQKYCGCIFSEMDRFKKKKKNA